VKLIVNDETLDFDAKSITNREAMALEAAVGMTFGQFTDALKKQSALAMTGMVWLAQRRSNPKLKFSEVEFTFGDLKVEKDEDEDEEATEPDPTSEADGTTSSPDD
jgi:hypothetical protein